MDHAQQSQYDAILFVSFGGPDKGEDVLPFLENVLRGRNVPKERMLEVAEHYHHFGGKSPINEQNIALIDAIRQELTDIGFGIAGLLGKSQLASIAHRYHKRNEGCRSSPSTCLRYEWIQLLFWLSSIS